MLVQPGLSTIYTGEKVIVESIIAVHGPDEDVFESFTSKNGTFWLGDKDMLPKGIPSCRILAFNYSTPHGSDPAIELAEELAADRGESAKERPIIFLCHSEGGTLVRDALAYSKNYDDGKRNKPLTSSIHFSTFGLLFFDNGGLLQTGSKLLQIVLNIFQRFCDYITSEISYLSLGFKLEDVLEYAEIREEHQDKCEFSS